MVRYVKQFRHFLTGAKFEVRTDHCGLTWLKQFKEPEGQLARWIGTLGNFNYEVKYRPGSQHRNADALSRGPCRWCEKLCAGVGVEDPEDNVACAVTRAVEQGHPQGTDELADMAEWEKKEVAKAQQEEPALKWIINHLRSGQGKPS